MSEDTTKYCTDCKWSIYPSFAPGDARFLKCDYPSSVEKLIPVARTRLPRYCSEVRRGSSLSDNNARYDGKYDICGVEAKNFEPNPPKPPTIPKVSLINRLYWFIFSAIGKVFGIKKASDILGKEESK